MTTKAAFIHTDHALNGNDEDRAALRYFVDECRKRQFNVVAVSAMEKAALQQALSDAGLAGKVVHAMSAEDAAARKVVVGTRDAFAEALSALNHKRAIARADILSPGECVAVSDDRKIGAAAAKAGMHSLTIEGNLRGCERSLDFALKLG